MYNQTALLCTLLAALPIWFLTTYFLSPLRRFPGPLLAGWTNLWRMLKVRQGRYHEVIHALHKKHGPVVRIAPNVLDLDFPELIKTIYDFKADYLKTEFYHGSSVKNNGKILYNIFSECDPETHARDKRPIAKHYSLTDVLLLEPHIDEQIEYLCQRLEEKFINTSSQEQPCDIDDWISFYTWDVVGKVTFSQPIGYLEKGYDFDNTLNTANRSMDYFAMVGQMPILDRILDKNPIYRLGPPSFGTITNISLQRLVSRLQKKDEHHDPAKPDFLDRFIEAKSLYPDVVDDAQIIAYLLINMVAGADTTSITITAALYLCLKNPDIWNRLKTEIPAATQPISYKSARQYPYLEAVIREAMRFHPAVAMTLERYVPAGGLTLPTGQYIPAGTIVGMNPYITSRITSIFGDDADVFRPERWLHDANGETESAFRERRRRMAAADLTFGGGSRVCIGKHLGLLQVYKVLATLVARYDISLVDPEREWETHNSFFVRVRGVKIWLARRD
ncbi:cytochrome P450 [Aspergillus karnatakaensis]|uniref:cytochrome P450 n=1 Tax=Aspergillus karnatakaensis TaxID=1810916 RepID=UPI003CCD3FB9